MRENYPLLLVTFISHKLEVIQKHKYILFGASLLLFMLNLILSSGYALPTNFYDEFSYLAIAAYFSGLDWSSMMYYQFYYSFGYPLIMVPLFWVFDNPFYIFRGAIILNAILASGSLIITYCITGRILGNLGNFKRICIAFTISMYSSYLMHVQLAWTESLLAFLVLGMFIVCIKLEEKSSDVLVVLFSLLIFFAFIVHMRFLGVLIAGFVAMLMFYKFNKINLKQLLMFISTVFF